ncbi:porin, partial [Acinetobacter nosocomialis]
TGIKQSSGGATVEGQGLGDAWSASVTYENPLFVAGLGYDKAIPSTFLGKGILNASDPEIAGGSVFAAANTVRAIGRLNPIEG